MAIAIRKKIVGMRFYFFALASMLGCTSCQLIDSTEREYEALFKKQKMIIVPYTKEHAARHGLGFEILMKREEASKVRAPDSEEFRNLLKGQLTAERSLGNNYCPDGYNVDRVIYSKHWYTAIWVNCKQ